MSFSIVRVLIKYGAHCDINQWAGIFLIVITNLLLLNSLFLAILKQAIMGDNMVAVKELLDLGIKVNNSVGLTALEVTVMNYAHQEYLISPVCFVYNNFS